MTAATTAPASSSADKRAIALVGVISLLSLALLAWILVFRRTDETLRDSLSFMPAVNAGLNSLASLFLVAGYVFIKRGQRELHRSMMLGAVTSGALFLCGYIGYHYVHGDTKYPGVGAAKTFYLSVLASHVLLSVAVVPLLLSALYFAFSGRFGVHKRITRWLFPIWLYVSITGVLIFVLLRAATSA